MNDTINPRQKQIVNVISQREGLSRQEIATLMPDTSVAKITFVRDLNLLSKKGYIIQKGKARASKYYASQANLIHRYFDLEEYFSKDPDDRSGARKTFNFDIFNSLTNIFSDSEIQEISHHQRSFDQEIKNKEELSRFIVELSWKSSKIEGNTYSLLETETLIHDSQEAFGHNQEEAIMILNHKRAFEWILDNKDDFKKISMSKINILHDLIVANLGISKNIRTHGVGITGSVYKPLNNKFQIEEAMEKTIELINKTSSPLEKAFIAKCMFAYIQPYEDGNKRTSRMLTNAILLAHGLFPISYRSVNADELKKAMILFYEQNSLYHLKRLFIEQLIFAFENYFT
ncbi:MAG: Fic family protein [Patescibacteria group bacterium]